MSYQELPMSCRQCAHRHSQYIYPSWSHKCGKVKPMVEGCNWKAARHPNFEEQQHAARRDGGVTWSSRSQSDFSHLPRIIGRIISECNDGEVQN